MFKALKFFFSACFLLTMRKETATLTLVELETFPGSFPVTLPEAYTEAVFCGFLSLTESNIGNDD